MKKIINNSLIALSILLFSSCSSYIRYGLTQKYYLSSVEKEIAPEQERIQAYENVVNIDTLNVPLNKIIAADDYNVFLGVSLQNSAKGLLSIYKKYNEFNFLSEKEENDTLSILFKKNNGLYYSILYDSEKDRFSYILLLTGDPAVVRNKFNTNFLINKLSNAYKNY